MLAVSDWFNPFAWDQTDWTAWAAIATFLAVVVALTADKRRRDAEQRDAHALRPQLSMTYRAKYDSAIEKVEVTEKAHDGSAKKGVYDGFYLRLAVTNAAGKNAARNVEVLIVSVEALEGAAGFESFLPWWTDPVIHLSSPPLGWTHSLTNVMTIPAGITRTVDLGVLLHKHSSDLRLGIHPQPFATRHFLTPGTYKVTLAVAAENADARYYELTLKSDGTWGAEQADVWDHVLITEPPKQIAPPTPGPSTVSAAQQGRQRKSQAAE